MIIKAHVVFDFDLTLVASESLADMIELGLSGRGIAPALRPEALTVAAERARSGKADLGEIARLLGAVRYLRRSDVPVYVERADRLVGNQVRRLFRELGDEDICVHILSSSYREWIAPLAVRWGVAPGNILANRFYWLGDRAIAARPSPLHSETGKSKVIRRWRAQRKFDKPVIMVGDSYADYLPYGHGLVEGYISADYYRAIPQALEDRGVRRAGQFDDLPTMVRSLVVELSNHKEKGS